jgi:hypothetical protein
MEQGKRSTNGHAEQAIGVPLWFESQCSPCAAPIVVRAPAAAAQRSRRLQVDDDGELGKSPAGLWALRRRRPRQPLLPAITMPTDFECPHYVGQLAFAFGLEPRCELEPCATFTRGLHRADVVTRVRRGRA